MIGSSKGSARGRPSGRALRAALCALVACGGALHGAPRPPAPEAAPPDPATAAAPDPAADPDLLRARDLGKAGQFAEAEALAHRLLEQAEREHGAQSLEVAAALEVLIDILNRARKAGTPDALGAARRVVAIKEGLFGPDSLEIAANLATLGGVLRAQGQPAEAETVARRAVSIREAGLGPDHLLVARALNQLAGIRVYAGNLVAAESDIDRAIAIFEREGVPEYPDLDNVLNILGVLRAFQGDFQSAIDVHGKVLGIREKALGPDHPDVTRMVVNMGVTYTSLGRFEEARRYLERALAADEARLGPDHPSVALDVFNLASLDVDTGDLVSARSRFERALAIRTRALGENHVEVAECLVRLGIIHNQLGDATGARAPAERGLGILEKTVGPNHSRFADALRLLADIDVRAGDFTQARSRYERALAIYTAKSPASPVVASTLGALCHLLAKTGRSPEAMPICERALRISEASQGPDHFLTGVYADILAGILRDVGRNQEARVLHERSLSILERALPAPHPLIARALLGLSNALARSDERDAALDAALKAETMGREYQDLVTRALPERQALALAADRPWGLDVALDLAADAAGDPAVTARAWDALIRSRALVFDEMAARRRDLAETDDAEAKRLAEGFVAASRDLANLLVRGTDTQPGPAIRKAIEEAVAARDDAERALAARSARFRLERENRNAGLREVAAAGPEGSALVAYALYKPPGPKTTSYLAFVLPAGEASPVVVPLGAALEIDALATRWRAQVTRGAGPSGADGEIERACRLAGAELRKRVWDPVAAHLAGAERVLVVPDGALNVVNLLALPAGDSGYLVERLPPLQYLTAERDVVWFATRRKTGVGLLAMGGPAYDAAPRAAARKGGRASKPGAGPQPDGAPAAFRGPLSECEDFRSLTFRPLPGSAAESREIERLWTGGQVLRLADAEATEATFKAMAPGRSVLHLATHGFFLDPDCPSALSETGGSDNPLRLSGLALAGANRRQQAGPDQEDGVLTAEEIAALNLSGVDLAVLSACNTGQGAVWPGEGVLGLRRAFQIAGVRTVVLSLWPIEDRSARSWMRRLYQGRLVRGLETAAAVREASLGLLKDRREREQSTHPVYWGGFVAAGDWR